MADNLSQKSCKSNEKNKYPNVINRTTSETMRLGEPEKVVNHPTTLITTTTNQRKKTPSFQITSVVTVGSRTSNDGGDDSADDLDESHTDDMSDVVDNSRITDVENETPSYSEDTFSKEDVFFNASTTSLGTAPVIPTSSQYGLAIVAPEGAGNILNAAVACAGNLASGDVHVSVTDSGNVIVGGVKPHEAEMRDIHGHHGGRNERFKVVKIESTEPFKRGRWLCMDYLDHTLVQQQPSQQAVINVVRPSDSSEATTIGSVQYVGPDSGVVITDGIMVHSGMDDPSVGMDPSHLKAAVSVQDQHHQAMVAAAQQHQAAMGGMAAGQPAPGGPGGNFPSISPGQTLQQVQQQPMPVAQHMSHQNIPPAQQAIPQGMQQVVGPPQMQQPPSQNQQAAQQMLPQHAQSMSQVSLQQNMTGAPQQPQQVAQHQSLPPQQIQQVMAAANMQQMQQQQQMQPQQQQGFPQQPNPPQQHITPQPGQSQGQYYTPASQQSMVQPPQMVPPPQTSISAQTQTSNSSQIPQGIVNSQAPPPQPVVSMSAMQGNPAHHQMQAQQMGQPQMQQQLPPQASQQPMQQQYGQQQLQQMQPQMQQQPQQMQQPPPQMQQPQQMQQPPQQLQQPQQMQQPPQQLQQPPQQMQQPPQQMQQPPQQMQQQPQPMQQQPQQMQQQPQQMQQQPPQMQQQPQQMQPPPQQQQQQQQMPPPQVMQQPPQQVLQQPQQPIHHPPTNMQQMHGGNVPVPGLQAQPQNVQPATSMAAALMAQGQGMITPHQMPAGQPPPSVAVPSSVSNIPPVSSVGQNFVHVSQTTVPNFVNLGTTTVASSQRTVPPVGGVGVKVDSDQQGATDTPSTLQESLAEVTTSAQDEVQPVATGEDAESASGTSAVAIDNKIEQAMDLVKSHLMFAVREEVEVLKEKIAELMDRINQLELENTILKANASQETLAQLSTGGPTKTQPTQQPPNGSVS